MVSKKSCLMLISMSFFLLMGCTANRINIAVEKDSVAPGSSVAKNGQNLKLLGQPISVGDALPSVLLVDAMTMKPVDLSAMKGSIVLLSIVPSIDTAVCEAQTHYLGEEGNRLPPQIKRITISRDTPFAQKRFAKEAKLEHLQFLSDYKEGAFGRATGLLIDGDMLLARSIIILDKEGRVRYIQVVPEITHLPDLERAFQKAEELAS
jgi:thiol peroxidase